MALADVLRQGRDHSLIRLISERFGERNEVQPLKSGDWVRASAYPKLCAREEVLCSLLGTVRYDVVDPDLNLIFLHGTALHWATQNTLAPILGVILGRWKCLGCGESYGSYDARPESLSLRPETCVRCGGDEFVYREMTLRSEEYHIAGHTDGLLRLPTLPGIGLLELKSISDRGFWEVRNTPLVQHVVQANVYMWLGDLPWAKIVYWNKGGNGVAALREHLIEPNPDLVQSIQSNLRAIWNGIEDGSLPPRICATETCPRATGCVVAKACFEQGDHVVVPKEDAGEQA